MWKNNSIKPLVSDRDDCCGRFTLFQSVTEKESVPEGSEEETGNGLHARCPSIKHMDWEAEHFTQMSMYLKKKSSLQALIKTVAKQTQHICGSHLQFWPLKLSTAHPSG